MCSAIERQRTNSLYQLCNLRAYEIESKPGLNVRLRRTRAHCRGTHLSRLGEPADREPRPRSRHRCAGWRRLWFSRPESGPSIDSRHRVYSRGVHGTSGRRERRCCASAIDYCRFRTTTSQYGICRWLRPQRSRRQNTVHPSCIGRTCFASNRRHWHPEHHARIGHGANQRNWRPNGCRSPGSS